MERYSQIYSDFAALEQLSCGSKIVKVSLELII